MKFPFRRHSGMAAKLVVGLGNPGKQYERSRHNLGFIAVDAWARRHSIAIDRKRPWAFVGQGEVVVADSRMKVVIAQPRTYMNGSGEAVLEMTRRHHVRLSDVLIVYDELDLPLGHIRLRAKGSAGGHRGIASIIDRLASPDFARLRIGIGRPKNTAVDTVDYVLGNLSQWEQDKLEQAITRSSDAIDEVLLHGVESAMNEFNARGDEDR